MDENKNIQTQITQPLRPGSVDKTQGAQGEFPFFAFEHDSDGKEANPTLTLKSPWSFEVDGDISATGVLSGSKVETQIAKHPDAADPTGYGTNDFVIKPASGGDVIAPGIVPIGSIIGIHKDFKSGYTPTIPDYFAPCNGAVISDSESPFDGETLPDLNSTLSGMLQTTNRGRYLRGGTTSGALNDSTYLTYSGGKSYGGAGGYYGAWVLSWRNLDGEADGAHTETSYQTSAWSFGDTPIQVSAMTVVYYMRIK